MGTADAARGAATKRRGWRRNWSQQDRGSTEQPSLDSTGSTQSDPSRGQQLPVSPRRVSTDGALCRPLLGARSPRCQWGREQPPGLDRVSTPTPARRVAHAPMSLPECSRILAVICAPNARVLSRSNALQIPRGTRCTSPRSFSPEVGHHHEQDRAVLGVAQGSRCARPCGLRP